MKKQPSTKRKIIKEYVPVYYDADTGEEITDLTSQEKEQADKESNIRFCKAFPTLMHFAKLSLTLQKGTFVLMIYIISNMSFNNKFYYKRNAIAKELGVSPATITKAFQELIKHGFCLPVDKDKLYVVNPEYVFRGRDASATRNWFNKLRSGAFTKKVTTSAIVKSEASTKSKVLSNNVSVSLETSKRYGWNKKVKILKYLLSRANEQKIVKKQVNEMVIDLHISKATIIPTLTLLKSEGYISRPSRGIIQILKFQELEKVIDDE